MISRKAVTGLGNGYLRATCYVAIMLVSGPTERRAYALPDAACVAHRASCNRRPNAAVRDPEEISRWSAECDAARACEAASCEPEFKACYTAVGQLRETGTPDAKQAVERSCNAANDCSLRYDSGRGQVIPNQLAKEAMAAHDKRVRDEAAASAKATDDAATAEANKAWVEAQQALDANPKEMQVVRSAILCALGEWRRDILKELSTQKRYSRLGGVENLSSAYDQQQRLRSLDEVVAAQRAELKALKKAALPCGAAPVKGLREYAVPDEVPEDQWMLAVMAGRLQSELKDADVQISTQ